MAEAASISRILMVVSIVVTRLTAGLVISASLSYLIIRMRSDYRIAQSLERFFA